MTADDRIFRTSFHCSLTHHADLGFGVLLEAVDSHHDGDAKAFGVFNVGLQVGQAGSQQFEVLFGVFRGKGSTGFNNGATAVHLERAYCCDQDNTVGDQPGIAALDVEKFFHADVGAEAGFSDDVITQFEGDPVSDDGTVAVGDICKGAGMYKGRGSFEVLHQGGHDGVFHQNGHGAGAAEILSGDRFTGSAGGDHDIAKTLAHVGQVRGQRQNSHDFTGDGDIKAGLAGKPYLCGALSNRNIAQHAVVDVDHAFPVQGFGIHIQAYKAADFLPGEIIGIALVDPQFLDTLEHRGGESAAAVTGGRAQAVEEFLVGLIVLVEHARVDGRSQQIVRCGDGVNITCQVQVEFLHRYNLAVAATGSATLDAEGRALARLADAGKDILAQVSTHGFAQANHGSALALAQGGGCDGGYVNVLPIRDILEAVEDLQADFGLEIAVQFQFFGQDANLFSNRSCGFQIGLLGLRNLDIRRDWMF